MNSRSRTTGTRKTNARRKKPATIDLKAKEVKASPAAEKHTDASVANKNVSQKGAETRVSENLDADPKTGTKPTFGRTAAKLPASEQASNPTSSGKNGESDTISANSDKSDSPLPTGDGSSNQKSGIAAGLIGAAAAVIGLGAIGQFDVARNIPLIGSIYAENTPLEAPQVTSQKITDLQNQLDQLISKNDASNIGGEETLARLNSAEENISELSVAISSISSATESGGSENPEFASALALITERLESLEASLSDTTKIGEAGNNVFLERLSALESKLESIDTTVTALQSTISAHTNKLQSMDAQTSSLETSIASVKASEKVAQSVAINTLGAALENDDSILLAVSSLETLIGSTPETQNLKALAEDGIPSRDRLLAALEKFTENTLNPPKDTSSGTISERFWANAQSLVSFRSSGPQQGESTVAILSRVKANLIGGNLKEVVSEWQKLPSNIAQRGTFWTEMLNKRIEAFALYEKLATQIETKAG